MIMTQALTCLSQSAILRYTSSIFTAGSVCSNSGMQILQAPVPPSLILNVSLLTSFDAPAWLEIHLG